jgi:hypothetical protein
MCQEWKSGLRSRPPLSLVLWGVGFTIFLVALCSLGVIFLVYREIDTLARDVLANPVIELRTCGNGFSTAGTDIY